ncbi:MAG TPA: bacillithiol biosynthesis cysteine-adding enzyme BshC [Polyangiales bacterium]|nr:bacillithiol biosynthesis cysteine-adding enzyme BshC [Polyangiales bacterium]
MTSSLFEAYLGGEARTFYPQNVRAAEARARAVELAQRRPIAPSVLSVLRAQQARLGDSAARERSLAALTAGGCAVVTGQQVGLFLGPLFTLYKAATAVKLAQTLQAETGRPVVPVFWLQTEDHDLPEIANCVVPRQHEAPTVISPEIAAHNRSSIAHLPLPAAIGDCVARLGQELSGLPHAPAHLERLARHYQPGKSWGDAFSGLIAELFEPEGLLVIDPRTPELAAHVAPIHKRALERSDAIAAALKARCEALEQAGFEATVHVRDDSPLCFYHPQGALGPRTRLRKEGEDFVEIEGGQKHSLAELCAALDRDPLTFSTSALLRPIVQDSLLPTAAYVGGPAELAYFAQLQPLYEAFEMEMSLIAPRARVRLIEPAAARLLSRLSLQSGDAALPEQALLARVSNVPQLGAAEGPLPVAPVAFERTLLDSFEASLTHALAALPTEVARRLAPQVDKTRKKLELTSAKLAHAYSQALLSHDGQRVSEVRRLKQLLFPGAVPQERVFGFAYFAARYGERPVIQRLLAAIDPYATQITELRL